MAREMYQPLLLALPQPPCLHAEPPDLRWRATSDARWHLGAWCRACGRWLRWVPQTPAILATAPPRPAA
jgi:hypothetical protein